LEWKEETADIPHIKDNFAKSREGQMREHKSQNAKRPHKMGPFR
jgi:hypothetical protein